MKAHEIQPVNSENEVPARLAISDFEESGRWVRGTIGGQTIVDSKNVMVMRRENRLPIYCFPRQDVCMDKLAMSHFTDRSDQFGEMRYWDVEAAGRTIEKAAWEYPEPPTRWHKIKDYVVFKWATMDAWFEEAEEVFVHPRDPYHRVDVVASTRTIKVMLAGEVVAESSKPRLLFETGFPTRYYLPQEDVRIHLLEPAKLRTRCPYKGVASYWSAKIDDRVFENIVWGYPDPIDECPKLKNLLCFFNEKVEAIFVDGEMEAKLQTKWS